MKKDFSFKSSLASVQVRRNTHDSPRAVGRSSQHPYRIARLSQWLDTYLRRMGWNRTGKASQVHLHAKVTPFVP